MKKLLLKILIASLYLFSLRILIRADSAIPDFKELSNSYSSFYINELLANHSGSRLADVYITSLRLGVDLNPPLIGGEGIWDILGLSGNGNICFPWGIVDGYIKSEDIEEGDDRGFNLILGDFTRIPVYIRAGWHLPAIGRHASDVILPRHMVTRSLDPCFGGGIGGDYRLDTHNILSGAISGYQTNQKSIDVFLNAQYKRSAPISKSSFTIDRLILGIGTTLTNRALFNVYLDMNFGKNHRFKIEYIYRNNNTKMSAHHEKERLEKALERAKKRVQCLRETIKGQKMQWEDSYKIKWMNDISFLKEQLKQEAFHQAETEHLRIISNIYQKGIAMQDKYGLQNDIYSLYTAEAKIEQIRLFPHAFHLEYAYHFTAPLKKIYIPSAVVIGYQKASLGKNKPFMYVNNQKDHIFGALKYRFWKKRIELIVGNQWNWIKHQHEFLGRLSVNFNVANAIFFE